MPDRTLTKRVLETDRHKGVVPVQDTQGVAIRVLQHEAEAEAMMAHILGVHGNLVENIPELGFIDIFHYHYPKIAGGQ